MKGQGSALALSAGEKTLVAAGFRVVSERNSESFGDRVIELSLGSCYIEIGLDRGQAFLVMRAHGGAGAYDMELWEGCLDDRSPSLEPPDFASTVELLIRRLPEFELLVSNGGDSLAECLRKAGSWRFHARRASGLIEPPPGTA